MVLKVERPSEGVVLLTLDLPDRRNAMTDELTAAWSATVDEPARGPRRPLRGRHRRREGLLRGRRPRLARGRRRLRGRSCATRCCRSTGPGSPARARRPLDRRGQRRGGRRRRRARAVAATSATRERPPSSASRSASSACTPGWPPPTRSPRSPASPPPASSCSPAASSTAAEMLRLGLCSAVYDDSTLLEQALAHAAEVASGAPLPARLHKEALRDGGPSLARGSPAVGGARPAGHDGHPGPPGGPRAKPEKRKPTFRGE